MTSPRSNTKLELFSKAVQAVRQFGRPTANAPPRYYELLFPDLEIYLDQSFRIFLRNQAQLELVYELSDTGEQELLVPPEELEADYVEALRRLQRNLVLDELANV